MADFFATVLQKAIPILIGILVFGVLIFIHELGHFLAARKCGIFVEEFAMGMGPKLIGREKNGTLYSLRLFPIGGFCKMLGEDENNPDERAFNNKKLWRRITAIAAGAVMNIVLAFVIFIAISLMSGYSSPEISYVAADTPASEAGLLPGDRIVQLNRTNVHIFEDLLLFMQKADGQPIDVTLIRDGQEYLKTITPQGNNGSYILGIRGQGYSGFFASQREGVPKAGFFKSISASFWEMRYLLRATISSIADLFTLNVKVEEMSGPIGIVSMIGETYQETSKEGAYVTFLNMLQFTGIISIAIGVFNLLPLPALDGGRLLFLAIEGIRRKPLKPETEGMIHFVGFVLLMILSVFIAYQDILKLI